MKKINLNLYKDSLIYFNLYDVKIDDTREGIEKFLQSIAINPSTYRKCKKGELIAGPRLIDQLTTHFNYKMPTAEEIDIFEQLFDDIYYKMYYKIYDDYDEVLKRVNELLDEQYTIYPIILLFKLLLVISSNKDYNTIINENISDYNELKKYIKFFDDNLYDVYELIYLTFEPNIADGYWLKNYNNGSAYCILSSRAYYNKRYIESIFFATKAKEFLSTDGNIIRMLFLNNTVMSSLLFVGNYQECNDIAFKQKLSLMSIKSTYKILEKSVDKYNIVSLLGLNRYSDIISILENGLSMNLTLLTCYMIAVFKEKGKKEYIKFFDDLGIELYELKDQEYLNTLNIILVSNRKSLLPKLENYEIEKWIINILKKIEIK